MANELTISASLKFQKGDNKLNVAVGGLRVDVTGARHSDWVQSIGHEADEAIALPADTGVGGYMMVHNQDATNYVTIRAADNGDDLIKLLPDDIALFRLTASAPFAIANTAACNVRFTLIPL